MKKNSLSEICKEYGELYKKREPSDLNRLYSLPEGDGNLGDIHVLSEILTSTV